MKDHNLIVILGPTASGKTRLAARLAHALQSEIISADSRQVYRRMNIGTGKDYGEYVVSGQQVPHHLIDIAEPGMRYHVHRFMQDFFGVFDKLRAGKIIPVMCGGSGLYIDSVLRNFEYASVPNDHELRRTISYKSYDELFEMFTMMPQTLFTPKADVSTAKRLIRAIEINNYLLNNEFSPVSYSLVKPLIFGLSSETETRKKRIETRLKLRLKEGLIEEVKKLMGEGVKEDDLLYYGLEYKFIVQYLRGEMSYDALEELLTRAIQQFAKRQMTYFRKMEKDGHVIHWIDSAMSTDMQVEMIMKHINTNALE
ncbi:MAG: tRNA (adenosine(37)-N6)-dimethylallyltransferase MiaA [Bacteroidota bacterium]